MQKQKSGRQRIDDLMTLIKQPDSNNAQAIGQQYETDADFWRELETLREQLTYCDAFEPPPIPPHRRVEIFEAAWRGSETHRGAVCYLDWPIKAWGSLRSFLTFASGLACGILFTLVLTLNEPESQSHMLIEDHILFHTMRGKAVERLYPTLEDPVMVIENSTKGQSSRQVIYGTMDEGNINVVWNL